MVEDVRCGIVSCSSAGQAWSRCASLDAAAAGQGPRGPVRGSAGGTIGVRKLWLLALDRAALDPGPGPATEVAQKKRRLWRSAYAGLLEPLCRSLLGARGRLQNWLYLLASAGGEDLQKEDEARAAVGRRDDGAGALDDDGATTAQSEARQRRTHACQRQRFAPC